MLSAFKKSSESLLELPEDSLPSPFAYHSTVNGEPNYVSHPRLSVSKLLTDSWCELREFFEVYAGLPRSATTQRMQTGSDYHKHLEQQNHATVDEELLESIIDKQLSGFPEQEQAVLTQNMFGSSLASHWTEQVLVRSLAVAFRQYAREMYVHGFLNFYSGKLATSTQELLLAVLINGIADIVKIDEWNIQKELTSAFPWELESESQYVEEIADRIGAIQLNDHSVVDLTQELPKAKKELDNLAKTHFLHVRDVKTRAFNSIPPQGLVVQSARVQCMYYAQFLANLSQSAEFAYSSNLENAKRRGVDVDEPIGAALAVKLLLSNFAVLAVDLKRLARGDPIGFEAYDNHKVEPNTAEYSLRSFVTESRFREMLAQIYGDSSNVMISDVSELFKPWKQPLTLRYFAARAGQSFNLFQNFKPASVCIEYHNVKSHRIIACKHFPFDMRQLVQSTERACLFWSGQRKPQETLDRSKCKKCDFRTRCPAINKPSGALAGDAIYELIES